MSAGSTSLAYRLKLCRSLAARLKIIPMTDDIKNFSLEDHVTEGVGPAPRVRKRKETGAASDEQGGSSAAGSSRKGRK